MKYFRFLIIITLMAFCLPACDPVDYFFDYNELKEEVYEVELINYNNMNAKMINGELDEILPFDFDKMESIEKLGLESIDDFLKELSTTKFHADSPFSISIRIIFSNEEFIILSSYLIDKTAYQYVGLFNSDGSCKCQLKNGSFQSLLTKTQFML